MAISIKKSSSAPVEKTPATSLPPVVQEQISNNLKLDTTDYTVSHSAQSVQASAAEESPKGKRSDDVVQLKFSKGKRAEAKAFFAAYDVKMNAGFEMAYEFLKEEVLAGRVKLSKSGVQRIAQ